MILCSAQDQVEALEGKLTEVGCPPCSHPVTGSPWSFYRSDRPARTELPGTCHVHFSFSHSTPVPVGTSACGFLLVLLCICPSLQFSGAANCPVTSLF